LLEFLPSKIIFAPSFENSIAKRLPMPSEDPVINIDLFKILIFDYACISSIKSIGWLAP